MGRPRKITNESGEVTTALMDTEVLKAPEDVDTNTKIDLEDLRSGWLFQSEKNQLLVTRHDREHTITHTTKLGRQVTSVPRSDRVIYEVGEGLENSNTKKVKGYKNISFEEFCDLIKEKGYQFKKVI